jgi:nuclear pore complex protein Nup133
LPDQLLGTSLGSDHFPSHFLRSKQVFTKTSCAGPFRSTFATDQGYALVLTASHAIIWPYAASSSAGDVLSITIPEWCRDSNGLPLLGTLVSNATCAAPGLVVLAPHTGKIIYWETATNAAFPGMARQRQNGLQGAIPGLLSGEYAIDVINAEPSGVVVTLSSGRVAHVAVRDPQGKSNVSVNFLRSAPRLGHIGLLDGIKSVLGNYSWRKNVAAARAGESSQRGQRDIIIASSAGLFEIWDTHWNNVNVLCTQVDMRRDICEALGHENLGDKCEHDLEILDLVVVPGEQRTTSQAGQAGRQDTILFCLVLLTHESSPRKIAVIKSRLLGSEIHIVSAHEVENPNFFQGIIAKPRLQVPKPWDTAFIVWGQFVILVSLTRIEESPSAQLLMDSNSFPRSFQDRLQFRNEEKYEILGSGGEDQSSEHKNPACLVMIRGFGLIRIAALPRRHPENDLEVARVTAKQKLEQAVFYGTMSNNPLDFDNEGGMTFPPEELEEAALDICKELLQSNSRFISSAALSVDQHLRLRAKSLNDLVCQLTRRRIPVSRRTRWELLWGAEKLAAHRALWKVEECFRRQREGSPTFLSRVLNLMSEKFKTKSQPVREGGDDHVRDWFIKDTYRMEHAIPWIFNAIRDSKGGRGGDQFSEQILQASELSLAILETAFRFREDQAALYGLTEEPLENGILLSSYEGLPEFWTSQTMVYSETEHMLDLELDSCRSWMQQTVSRMTNPDPVILSQIARNSFRRLRILGKMHLERVQWLSAQDESKLGDERLSVEESHKKQRKWQLFKLAGIGQLQGAIYLAEEFRDMDALVELMVELQDQIKDQKVSHNLSSEIPAVVIDDMDAFAQKIGSYFEKFGEPWADAFFSRQIIVGQPGMLLSMREYQPHVTRFLKKFPGYARLAWINEVIGEDDYESASRTLQNLALEQESNLWDKRVEISLAKLTRLATWEKTGRPKNEDGHGSIRKLDDLAEIGGIQELVYEHILPALHGAIDQRAALELAMDHFGKHVVANRPALRELLEDALARMIDRQVLAVEQLVDLLTLMDSVHFLEGDESGLLGREFHLALRILRLSGYADTDPTYHDVLQKMIWRRCMIRDDWEAIGETDLRPDAELESHVRDTALFRTLTECAAEGKDSQVQVQN